MQFLSAPLLFGLVLAGVPILIHLLNRRRFQLVEWAPMKYLKLTIRSNRRRMRIEQLLLLALRTLLMLLLVLTVARPVLAATGIGSWLARRSRVSRIIVLDDSLSMGYRFGGHTALDTGKEAALEIIRGTGAQDAVTFATTTGAGGALVREASVGDPSKLASRINSLQSTDAASNWPATFKTINDYLLTATFPQKELVLITDMRRNGWGGGVTELANHWATLGVHTRVIDVGVPETSDVSLARFVQEDALALPGSPLRLAASIHNGTPAAIEGAQATLTVDGQSRPVLLPTLAAGSTIDLPLSVVLNTPGQHALRLSLPDDALNADNVRYLSVNVREKLDLTIVDGRQGAGPFESAGDFLHLAFTVGQDPWRVQRVAEADPRVERPVASDVLVLADLASVSGGAAAACEKLVRQGMGLMIFAGEQVDAQAYNDRLFRDGAGLLPARLDRVVEGPVRGLVVEGYADSPLTPLSRIVPAALAKIQTRRLLAVELPTKLPEGVRVLARWNDAEGHPAVIEKRLGRGRVLFWTTSADREWTDWPVDPTYVLAVRSAALAAAWPDAADDDLVAGQPAEHRSADESPRLNPRILPPAETVAQPLLLDGYTLRYPHTERAGIYTLTWNDAAGKQQDHRLAVSFDKNASDLERLSDSKLLELLGSLGPELVHYRPEQLMNASSGREIWRMLATGLFGLLFLESMMAFWVGRHR